MRSLVAILAVAAVAVSAAPAGAYVYWSDFGPLFGSGGSTLVRANQDASGLRSPFVSGAGAPTAIAVDGQYLYWANTATNAIARARLDGSNIDPTFIPGATATTAVSGRSPQGQVAGLALDGHYIYWTDNAGFIGRASLDGSGKSPTWVDTGKFTAPFGIAITPSSIYVGLYGSIAKFPVTGGASHSTVATDANWVLPPAGLVVLGGYVYYSAQLPGGDGHGIVGRVPAGDVNDSPTPHDNAFITGLDLPLGLATDGTYLYWADNSANAIGRARLAALGDRTDSFVQDSGGPFGLAVDNAVDPTATTVACTPASVAPGATTTCKATVTDAASSAAPTGNVAFTGNATTPFLGGASTTCTLTADPAGGASCVVGAIPQAAGTAPITAEYQGDPVHAKSSGTTSVCVGAPNDCGQGSNTPPPPAKTCTVPKVRGKSLARAKKLIRKAGCAVGKVRRPKKPSSRRLRPLVVAAQKPGGGRAVPLGKKVTLRLKERPRRH